MGKKTKKGTKSTKIEQKVLEAVEKQRDILRAKGWAESSIKDSELWGECPFCGFNVLLDYHPSLDSGDRVYAFSKSKKLLEPVSLFESVFSSGCKACGKTFYYIWDGRELLK